MSGSANTFVQSLESRLFLSATVHTSADSATILADRQQIDADRSAASQSYSSDYGKVQADQAKKKADLAPLKSKLEADKSACYATLFADEQAIAAARKAGSAVVQADEQALKTDATDAGKLEADKQKLMADYKAFSDTLSALKTKRSADSAACEAKCAADNAAIKAVCATDDGIIHTDLSKLESDRAQWQTTILKDLAKLAHDLGGSTGGTTEHVRV